MPTSRPSRSAVYSNSTPVTWPSVVDEALRPGVELDLDAVGLGEFLLVVAGAHPVGAAAIDDGHILGAEALDWAAMSMAVMPPPITTTRRPTGSADEVLGLAQLGDVVDRVARRRRRSSSGKAERVDAAKAEAEEDRVEVVRAARRG